MMDVVLTRRYMSRTDIATYLGVSRDTAKEYRLPPPDVVVGDRHGWARETVDAWVAARPGNAGKTGRPRKAPPTP